MRAGDPSFSLPLEARALELTGDRAHFPYTLSTAILPAKVDSYRKAGPQTHTRFHPSTRRWVGMEEVDQEDLSTEHPLTSDTMAKFYIN